MGKVMQVVIHRCEEPSRNMWATPASTLFFEQIIVTSGAQQALDLLARVLLDPGDEVWMEDPGYPGAAQAFQSAGASVIPIPVDGNGIDVARAIKSSPAARVCM